MSDYESVRPQEVQQVALDEQQLAVIARSIPGGAANVQGVYPLSPVQEGMLFHSLLKQHGDTYVVATIFELQSRDHAAALIAGLQSVIDRHEVLRTAILREKLPRPVQVVCRTATLPVRELSAADNGDPLERLREETRPERQTMDLRQAPLLRVLVSRDAHRCYAALQIHHIISDHRAFDALIAEAMLCIQGREAELPALAQYRDYVLWSLSKSGARDAEVFFRQKLHGFREPSAPFGLLDTRGDGGRVDEARQLMEPALSTRVREETRKYGVSAARLFHAAYGLVVAQSCGRDDVVYGTVLLAAQRRRAQAQSMLGLFVNTLPLRLPIADLTVSQFVRLTSRELEELLAYQQSSLALAQRCSGVVSPLPLFTAVLNYRNSVGHTVADPTTRASAPGIRLLEQNYRTHYPVTFTVDNLGEDFALIAQTERPIDPRRMIGYVQNALRALLDALGTAPDTPALGLPVVPVSERGQLAMGASIAGGNAGGSKAAAPAREYEPPEGEIERIVATAWQEVLEVDRVGREDDFFGLGGQSLPAMEAIDLIAERLSIEIPLEVLFEYPTVRQLAVQIAELTQRPASAPAALRAEIT